MTRIMGGINSLKTKKKRDADLSEPEKKVLGKFWSARGNGKKNTRNADKGV